jgi:hypothetical protein
MNIAANQAIYPQTPTHLSYPNGAIIQNPMQQPNSLVRKSYADDNLIYFLILGILSSYGTNWSGSINIIV